MIGTLKVRCIMDPKKTWVCSRGHQYTDFNRVYGNGTECPYCLEEEYMVKCKEQMPESYDCTCEDDAIHGWFGLSYASYLVLQRTVLQSMPQEWQRKFVALLEELDSTEWAEEIPRMGYTVLTRDSRGRIMRDPLRDYDRGRRILQRKQEVRNADRNE